MKKGFNTVYFDYFWSIQKFKPRPVNVGFLYTDVNSLLSLVFLIKVSRKGRVEFCSSSKVNFIFEWILLIYSLNLFT